MHINGQRLLERFLRYVQIETTADPHSETYPSSACQRDLAELLAKELVEMGAEEAHVDDNSLVWATVPATDGCQNSPAVALVAHMDTSPEAPGANVQPRVIEDYPGGDITLASGAIIEVKQCPALEGFVGKTLVTTDGNTLLGGDDKAGVAIIMELAETLLENPHLAHGPVRLLFTCDEEIGHGTDKIDLEKLNANVAYTIDGGGASVIDVETFSADGATVTFTGHNIHPAIAKGRMINSMRSACDFVGLLPRTDRTPETTADREGFIHTHSIRGGVGSTVVELILRSFDEKDLLDYAELIRECAGEAAARVDGVTVDVQVYPQYRNLGDGLRDLPEAVGFAKQAFDNLQRPWTEAIIRGGTDGSQLTAKGLPTPNLSSGQHNIHAVTEFACLDEMVEATEHLVELTALWGRQRV